MVTGTGGSNSISVFFPAFNDAPSLPALIARTFAVLEPRFPDFEVIIVDDGSRDNTADVLAGLEGVYGPRLRVIEHPENRGYGGALRTGFKNARNELVFYTDGDAQYDVSELPVLLALMTSGVGLVNGYKIERNDPWHRIVIGKVYNQCARFLFRIRIRDIDCDFRLVRRELVERLDLTSTSGSVCVELVRKLELSGYEVREAGVHHYPRLHGRSQFFRWRSLLHTFRELLALHWRVVLAPRWQLYRAWLFPSST